MLLVNPPTSQKTYLAPQIPCAKAESPGKVEPGTTLLRESDEGSPVSGWVGAWGVPSPHWVPSGIGKTPGMNEFLCIGLPLLTCK